MTNVVLLGGNGYIGRNVTEKWLKEDPSAVFYIISRSGKNQFANSRIYNLAADVSYSVKIKNSGSPVSMYN